MRRPMTAILIVVLKGNSFRSYFFSIWRLSIHAFRLFFRSLDSEEHPETGEPEMKKAKNSE